MAEAVPGLALRFPEDTGAHPAFRIEWWYVTGWLDTPSPQATEYGFQLTFFRLRTGIGEDNPSRFAPEQLLIGHVALSDPALGRLRHAERVARRLPPLIDADTAQTRVRIEDWSLVRDEQGGYALDAGGEGFSLALSLAPSQPPMLNGRQGFSQKGPDPAFASHYYSVPGLQVHGALTVDGLQRPVSGVAWLDQEWSSGLMPPGAQGWDWVGLNLDDGGAIMAFRMRDAEGNAIWRNASVRDADGRQWVLAPDALRFTPLRYWVSPRTGIRYPVSWQLRFELPDDAVRELVLEPLIDDQELDATLSTGAIYYEGAVRVRDLGGASIGRGYLEMTGYGDALDLY